MQPHESPALLASALAPLGAPPQWRPADAVARMFDFYRDTVAERCLGPEQDVLLLRWGLYDWGDGEFFELDLTRQFALPDGERDRILQLSLTFRYAPEAALRALRAGSRWCASRAELSAFARDVASLPVLRALEQHVPVQALLRYDDVEE